MKIHKHERLQKSFEHRIHQEEINVFETRERLVKINQEIDIEMKKVAIEMHELEQKQLFLAGLKHKNTTTIHQLGGVASGEEERDSN